MLSDIINKNVLIAPLDWGLGHATRCIPIIEKLKKQGCNIILASAGRALLLLRQEFPNLVSEELPAYNIIYSNDENLTVTLFSQIPKVLNVIWQENKILKTLIQKYDLDIVISDNRFGLYSQHIPSYIITHQLQIQDIDKRWWMQATMNWVNNYFLNKFNAIWVPDYNDDRSLSGALSHNDGMSKPIHYLGPLSRFQDQWMSMSLERTFKLVILISGPEPQRTIFEKIILREIDRLHISTMIVLGKPEYGTIRKYNNYVTIADHLLTAQLFHILSNCETIVCRSGYSTIMDIAALGKKAILIPTPGQAEQIYLANYFKSKNIFFAEEQRTFDLQRALHENQKYKGFII